MFHCFDAAWYEVRVISSHFSLTRILSNVLRGSSSVSAINRRYASLAWFIFFDRLIFFDAAAACTYHKAVACGRDSHTMNDEDKNQNTDMR